MEIITRKDALAQGLSFYFTGKPCKYGHTIKRRVNKATCIECERLRHYRRDKTKLRKYNKDYRERHPERERLRKQKQYKENKDSIIVRQIQYHKEKRLNDPLFRFKNSVRQRVYIGFKRKGYSKTSKTAQILGCDWEKAKAHIENKFTDGMSWDNYGEWEIDHIKPLALGKSEAALLKLNHYTNLQPLWKSDNRRKWCKTENNY